MLGMANYNQKCWNYLFKGRWGLGPHIGLVYFSLTLFVGAIGSLDDMINLMDVSMGLMVFPNMIAVLMLAPKANEALSEYFKKYL